MNLMINQYPLDTKKLFANVSKINNEEQTNSDLRHYKRMNRSQACGCSGKLRISSPVAVILDVRAMRCSTHNLKAPN